MYRFGNNADNREPKVSRISIVIGGNMTRQNPRIFRQNIAPVQMSRADHLEAYRGLLDVNPDYPLGRYCYERNISVKDRQWMKLKIEAIQANHQANLKASLC